MKDYVLSVYQPDGVVPAPDALQKVMLEVNTMIQDAKTAGVWLFNAGLHPAASATVVRIKGGEAVITDGPYVEGKEHIGGFMIVRVPDLDAALTWARRFARALTLAGHADSLPIEVRPLQH